MKKQEIHILTSAIYSCLILLSVFCLIFGLNVGAAAAGGDAYEAKIGDIYYDFFEDAVSAANSMESATVVVLSDVEISSTVKITGNITITDDGTARTISRADEWKKSSSPLYNRMFYIYDDASLTFSGSSGNDENITLTIDGGGTDALANGQIVSIGNAHGATSIFIFNAGVRLTNNSNSNAAGALSVWGKAYMNGGIIDGNSSEAYAGAVYVRKDAVFYLNGGSIVSNVNSDDQGSGAVYVSSGGTMYMSGGLIADNSAPEAGSGAISVHSDAVFYMTGGTIKNNTSGISSGAGAVYIATDGNMYFDDGVIEGNSAKGTGGAIRVCNAGCLHMTGGTIKNNSSAYSSGAGGVYIAKGGIFYLDGGSFVGNMCSNAYGAGAISVSNGSYLYMSGGTITDNTCTKMSGCGGIAVRDGGTVEMCGGSVTGNHTNFEQDNSSIRIVGEDSTFKISGSAYVDIILLDTNLEGCNIIVAGNLTTADTIGVSVSPLVGSEEAEKGYVILGASEYNADNYSKFKLVETWSFFKIVYDEELKTAVMAVDESQFKTAKVSSSEVFSYKTAGNIGGNVQSACTDGTYVYIAIEQAVKDGSSYISGTCHILKIDPSSWSVLGVYGPYDTNHSNDMTYNPETRELIITNNTDNATTDDVDESHVVTCISTETFEVTRTIEINFTGITNGMYSLSYSSAYDKYVAGIKGSYNIAFTDENFEDFEYIIGMSGFTKQNNYLSDEYIYSVRTSVLTSANTNRKNYIVVYDWDGNYIEAFCISNTNYEIESIFELNGKLYAVFIPSSTYTGVVIYELSGIIDTLEDSSDSSGSASGILRFFQRIIAFFRRIFDFLGLM